MTCGKLFNLPELQVPRYEVVHRAVLRIKGDGASESTYQNNKEHVVSVQEMLITMILGMVFELAGPGQSVFLCSMFNLVTPLRNPESASYHLEFRFIN